MIDFYLTRVTHVVREDWYIRFKKSSLVPDLWIAACAFLGAIGLIMDYSFGQIFTIITGSSLLFRGLMHIAFNIQNNLFRLVRESGQMKFEVFINIWTIGFGIALIVLMWPDIS